MDIMDFVLGTVVACTCIGGLCAFLSPFYEEWLKVRHRELDNERRAIELGVSIIPKGFKK